jgi:hypothetical protein
MARLIGTDIIEKLEVINFLFLCPPENGVTESYLKCAIGIEGAI